MMSDNLPPTDDKYLKALSRMIDIHFEDIKGRFDAQDTKIDSIQDDLRERITEVKDTLRRSDETFEKRVDKIDRSVETLTKEHRDHLISFTKVETKSDITGRNWGAIMGVFAGMIASIVVTVITKIIGF